MAGFVFSSSVWIPTRGMSISPLMASLSFFAADPCEMGQEVIDEEDGIVRIFADGDVDSRSVGFVDDADEGEGHADPLVLQDAAVIMGF